MRGRRAGFAGQVPTAVEELPGDLEGDEGLAGAGGQREEDALLARGDRLHDAFDGDVLVVAARVRAALVLEGHSGEMVTPGVRFGEGQGPELVGRGIGRHLALLAGPHVDAVDALAVR